MRVTSRSRGGCAPRALRGVSPPATRSRKRGKSGRRARPGLARVSRVARFPFGRARVCRPTPARPSPWSIRRPVGQASRIGARRRPEPQRELSPALALSFDDLAGRRSSHCSFLSSWSVVLFCFSFCAAGLRWREARVVYADACAAEQNTEAALPRVRCCRKRARPSCRTKRRPHSLQSRYSACSTMWLNSSSTQRL